MEASSPLRRLLFGKYLYPESQSRSFPIATGLSGLTFTGPTGAPYLLAVWCSDLSLTAAFENATNRLQEQPTIGSLALFSEDEAKVFRRRFVTDGWDEIPDLEYCSGLENGPKSAARLFTLPITKELESLFFEIHSAMRDIDGLHADEALDELCKLIYTRSFEEDAASKTKSYPLSPIAFATTEQYAAAIRSYYKEAADYDLRVFRLKIPQYERSRGVFNQPIRLSSAALVQCYKMLADYDLSGSQTDVKGRAFQKVLGKTIRSGMGQYFTPSAICEMMVEIVAPKSSDLVLDPFCGSGHFLTESLKRVGNEEGRTTKAFHEFAFGKLHGIEKSERMVRVAMTDMRLSGDGHSNIRCTDALLDFANYPDIAPDSFDIVITNPPFGSILGSDALASLGNFELAKGRKNSPLEIIGMERSIQFLRPGGRLAILLPDSIFSIDSTKSLRSWLLDRIVPRLIISLPHETFTPFGANVKTSILFARKMRHGEKYNNSQKVRMIKVTNVGYDATGRESKNADLSETAQTALTFISEEGW